MSTDLSAAQVIAEELRRPIETADLALQAAARGTRADVAASLILAALAAAGYAVVKLPEAEPCFRPIVMWQAVCHHCEKVFDADEEIVAWTDPHGAQDYAECAEWDFRTIDGVMQATCWSCVEAAQIAAAEAVS